MYPSKEYTEKDLKQEKIHNFANVTITVHSDNKDLEKTNGVGEFIITPPDVGITSGDEDDPSTVVTPLLDNEINKNGQATNTDHQEEEEIQFDERL